MENFTGIAIIVIMIALVFISRIKNRVKASNQRTELMNRYTEMSPPNRQDITADSAVHDRTEDGAVPNIQQRAVSQPNIEAPLQADEADPYGAHSTDSFEHDRLVQGVIMAEILGKPKALK